MDLRFDPPPVTPILPPRRSFRDRIFSGLVLALPLLVTLWILGWLYSILDHKVIEPVTGFLLWKVKWTASQDELPVWFERYAAPVLAVLLVLGLLYTLDLLADTRLRKAVSWLLTRVPVFSHVYSPMQQIFQSLEKQPQQDRPQRMVLVTFPHPGVKLPAFVTGKCRDLKTQKDILCVYVPTTPVPTSGFFLLVPEEETTDLNWNTEQTLQAVMSGGLSTPLEVSFFHGPIGTGAPLPAPAPPAAR